MLGSKRSAGFSMVELLVSMSVLAIFFTLGTIVFNSWVVQDRLGISSRRIISLAGESQSRAWANYSEGGPTGFSQGIYFGTDQVVVFSGSSYQPGLTSNQVFDLPSGVEIQTVGFTNRQLVFLPLSGLVANFVEADSYLVLADTRADSALRVSFNEYGIANVEFED